MHQDHRAFYRRLVASILAVYWVLLAWQAWHVGLTFDEPTHMLGSYLYWLNRPDLPPEDLPPLTKILDGWIPLVLDVPLHLELPVWQGRWKQDVASEILDRLSPERIRELFYLMRLMRTLFPMLLAWLVWRWARELFGDRVAALVLLVAVLSPTALAHGPLLKTDVASAFLYLWFAYTAWGFWREPCLRSSAQLGASVLLAMLVKTSLLITGPLALALVLARLARGPHLFPRWAPAALLSVLLIPYAGLLAAYRFDVRCLTREDLAEMRAQHEFPRPVLLAAQVFRFLPTPTHVQKAVRSLNTYERYGAHSYMLGEARHQGHWAYYLLALAVKIPIAVQVLCVAGLLVAAFRRDGAALVLVLPAAIYLAAASQSDLQLGVRLVMPARPFATLLTGFAIRQAIETRRGQAALVVLLAWLAGASAFIYPQGLAYFNEWAGGPAEGWKYLVDSNLDWGQNMPDLARWVRENRVRKLTLYYFGYDKLHRYGLQDIVEPAAPPWSAQLVSSTRLDPKPGLYAISATLLPGHFFPQEYRDYFQYFRSRTPDARAGYGIFIYRVP